MKKVWFILTALVATCFLVACSGSQGVSPKTIKERRKLSWQQNLNLRLLSSNRWLTAKIRWLEQISSWPKLSVKNLGVKVEFSVMSFDNVLANVQSGKADIAIAGIFR